MSELIPKWNAKWELWHWCTEYRGPTLCGIKRLRSIGECTPTPRNRKSLCKRCASAKRKR